MGVNQLIRYLQGNHRMDPPLLVPGDSGQTAGMPIPLPLERKTGIPPTTVGNAHLEAIKSKGMIINNK